ncbi:hypothetical protein AV540_00420 [Brevibacillus parabrevis]|uniref:DUF6886 family protein n=1 Tax=Brevibacillus parabrevis TaxID=54914 RepID=UPI0007AB20F1|nr:DUF6886 family protein [Brevibacillus parabrevis]KZE51472.1 hypothetical protein AV540_00420 [Brevibacillus parabrevis]
MHTVFHYSEDSTIADFQPRLHPSHPSLPPLVWAIDAARAPMYYFPRDCPRIAFYAKPDSSAADQQRFLGLTSARMVIAIESRWYPILAQTTMYQYTFAADSFSCLDEGAGYFVSKEPVQPLQVTAMGDLLACLGEADVELRITPSLAPLKEALLDSSLHFSMIRMRNAR